MRVALKDVALYVDVSGPALVPDGRQMRERPTIVAPPYINGPITHVDLGHQVPVSAVTAAAAANADVVCPDGNDCRDPSPNPFKKRSRSAIRPPRQRGWHACGHSHRAGVCAAGLISA